MKMKKPIIGTNLTTGRKRKFESAHQAYRKLHSEGIKVSRSNIVYALKGTPKVTKDRPNPSFYTSKWGLYLGI